MKKPISPRLHGVLDYATVAATAAAPEALDLPDAAANLCYALAGGYLTLSLLTDYPLAAKRAIPFKGHGVTEAVIGLALPALPWALGFSDNRAARNVFFGLTALTAVVSALTDWEGEGQTNRARRRAPARAARALRRKAAAVTA